MFFLISHVFNEIFTNTAGEFSISYYRKITSKNDVFIKGKRTSKKSINFFLKFEKNVLEASNIMYILPSEYVSIRKYGHLKFRYS